ncbi:hypothetical protein ABFX02_03G114100 [Erythranthe guttata]
MIFLPRLQKRFFHTLPKFPTSCLQAYVRCRIRTTHTLSNNGFIDFFDSLLHHCVSSTNGSCNHERPVKQIHAQIILTSSLYSSAFLSARLISSYSKLSLLNDARKVFDNSPEDCFFSSLFWNSMLRAYVSDFRYENAIQLYCQMREFGVQQDGFGFPLIIKACAMRGDVRLCRSVHCHVIQMGFRNNLHVNNELVGMYGEIGLNEVALQVFGRMPLRSCVSWNVMISGFTKNHDCEGAFTIFSRMENEGWEPNSVTWTSLISSFARCGFRDKTWELYVSMREKGVCATAESIAVVVSVCDQTPIRGSIVHAHVISAGFEKYIFVINALISMYGKNGDVEKAEYLFSGIESKSIVSWNALISAYAQSRLCDEALSAFLRLNSTARPNVVSWTAVINAFATSDKHKSTTLELFRNMQFARVSANAVTVATVLSVCAELSALPLGREIHAHTIRKLIDSDILVKNGLINMYMKCSSLRKGYSVFEGTICKDVISWNIMITGYGIHGLGKDALGIFHRMVSEGIKPDEVTFVAVLSACSHSGLVAQGDELFEQMNRVFRIEPKIEHYACMVDLFGRAGLLDEAGRVLKSMPMRPNVHVWGAFLNTCKMHENTDSAEEICSRIFDLESEGTMGSYMLLSNLYAANKRWDQSADVRLSAKKRGLKKIAGQSWI